MTHYLLNLMSPSERDVNRFVQWWSGVQQQGKLKYSIKYGLLFIPAFAFFLVLFRTIFDITVGSLSLQESLSSTLSFSSSVLLLGIVVTLIGGFAFGLFMWGYNRRLYQELQRRQRTQ